MDKELRETYVEECILVAQEVNYGVCQNEPHRLPIGRRKMDQGPKLVHSDIHCCIYADVLLPVGCSQVIYLCGRNAKASLFWMFYLDLETPGILAKSFLACTRIWNASTQPFLPLFSCRSDVCVDLMVFPAFTNFFFFYIYFP